MSSGWDSGCWAQGCSLSQPHSGNRPLELSAQGFDKVKAKERLTREIQEAVQYLATAKAARSPCVLLPYQCQQCWVGGEPPSMDGNPQPPPGSPCLLPLLHLASRSLLLCSLLSGYISLSLSLNLEGPEENKTKKAGSGCLEMGIQGIGEKWLEL